MKIYEVYMILVLASEKSVTWISVRFVLAAALKEPTWSELKLLERLLHWGGDEECNGLTRTHNALDSGRKGKCEDVCFFSHIF